MTRQLGVGVVWVALLVIAAAPFWSRLPEPDGARVVRVATVVKDGAEQQVGLPKGRIEPGGWTHLRLVFDTAAEDEQYLFVPLLSQRAVFNLNGTPIDDTANRTTMVGLASGVPALIPLPPRLLRTQANVVDVHLQTVGLVPGYLSSVYIGSADQLAEHYRMRVFLLEYVKFTVPAAQLLLLLLLLTLWLYRPRDLLFGWLAVLVALSMTAHLGMVRDLLPSVDDITAHLTIVASGSALVMLVVTLLMVGRTPPRWLRVFALVLPLACLAVVATGSVPTGRLVLALNAPVNILAMITSLAIFAWAAVRNGVEDAWLMLVPMIVATAAAVHDLAMALRWIDGSVFLSVYYRPLLLIGFAMVLMRRMGSSLTTLDDVNAHLTQRLAQRERELGYLYAEREREAAELVRQDERRRLTDDLHDGLSGHLVSIIALSEKERLDAVEKTAREALDDLRLVINSLDIGEGELRAALAGLRERLERQLKRIGVALEWSMSRLPEISGVTPSHALNVLRIVQEAVTNAIKHARASRIRVTGRYGDGGEAIVEVVNDGRRFPDSLDGVGAGLSNIRRRAAQLNGRVDIEALDDGARLQLVLPTRLP